MTHREKIVLRYLDNLMGASARMIGEHVRSHGLTASRRASHIGGSICGHLKQQSFVIYLTDLKAWRITELGRHALTEK